jgi:hypothetical protein
VNIGAEDTSSPYSTTWNTTTAGNGSHAGGDCPGYRQSTKSASVAVTVSNAAALQSGLLVHRSTGDRNERHGQLEQERRWMQNGPTWTTGVSGSALNFDSVNTRFTWAIG